MLSARATIFCDPSSCPGNNGGGLAFMGAPGTTLQLNVNELIMCGGATTEDEVR